MSAAIMCGKRRFSSIYEDISSPASPPYSYSSVLSKRIRCSYSEQSLPQHEDHRSEWVEMLLREMTSAPNMDMDDAKARASRFLEEYEKFIHSRTETFQKEVKQQLETVKQENTNLKGIQHEREKQYNDMNQKLRQLEQLLAQSLENLRTVEQRLETVVGENTILKKGVSIQYESQKKYDGMTQEMQQLKQLVHQYEEQIRTLYEQLRKLELKNYELELHLRQDNNTMIFERLNPDVF
ncbi:hypothetical protein MKW98_015372 [Papaver atlanticum]|uniref:Uncharacterized protein n=1 Tax=Papaver atlanticum TaxID=357466 RepID=A0AAD4X4Q9_9MAGN|nr:hypothetical protein MKW98_015372 [Papaver atlanticum]